MNKVSGLPTNKIRVPEAKTKKLLPLKTMTTKSFLDELSL